jgi:HD superfamily phosphodiesterase
MDATEQTKGQSVLDHGLSVWKYTQNILNKNLENYRVPLWLIKYYDDILANVYDHEIIKLYNIFHDCGKPYCLRVDEDGSRHFPDHANVSKQTWLKYNDNSTIANLIGLDMLLHSATAEEINQTHLTRKDKFTLLITALAELHSNANMFGGLDSVSFKSKWKKLDRRGNMFIKEEFGTN